MKHYPHHISDFNNATRHLNRVERGLYRDLIELYYETEKPLPVEVVEVARRIVANELSTDVERMLNEFFIQTPQGWYHVRCDEEISKYQSNNSQRAVAGKASAAKKALKKHQALNGDSTSVEFPLNENSTEIQNQSTNQPINHKPMGIARATRIPDNFEPIPESEAEAGIDRQKELANFRDYWNSKARDNTKLDWQATWRQWARKADRPGVSKFAKPAQNVTVPSRMERDPELTRLDIERSRSVPMPQNIREQMQKLRVAA